MFVLPAQRALPIDSATADVAIIGGRGLLTGWALAEGSGAAVASCIIRDGGTTGGQILVPVNLNAGESTRDFVTGSGIVFQRGLFFDNTGGNIVGAIFVVEEQTMDPALARYIFGGGGTLGAVADVY